MLNIFVKRQTDHECTILHIVRNGKQKMANLWGGGQIKFLNSTNLTYFNVMFYICYTRINTETKDCKPD